MDFKFAERVSIKKKLLSFLKAKISQIYPVGVLKPLEYEFGFADRHIEMDFNIAVWPRNQLYEDTKIHHYVMRVKSKIFAIIDVWTLNSQVMSFHGHK